MHREKTPPVYFVYIAIGDKEIYITIESFLFPAREQVLLYKVFLKKERAVSVACYSSINLRLSRQIEVNRESKVPRGSLYTEADVKASKSSLTSCVSTLRINVSEENPVELEVTLFMNVL